MAQAVIRARTDLDASGFNKGIQSMQASAMKLKGFVAGAFSVGAIAALAKSTVSAGGDMADLADNLSITTTQLQALQYGFRNTGSDAETMATMLSHLKAKAADAAKEGGGPLVDTFARLGINLEEISDLNPAEQMERIAHSLAMAGENGVVLSDVIDLVGKSGKKATNAITELGKQGLESLIVEAMEAGNVATEKAVRSADKLDDKLGNITQKARVAAINLAGIGADDLPEEPTTQGPKKSAIAAQLREAAQLAKDIEEAEKLRLDTAEKLAAHTEKQKSDTEKIVDLMAELRELNSTVLAYDAGELEKAKLEAAKAAAQIQLDELMSAVSDAEKTSPERQRFDDLRRIGGNLAGGMSKDPRVEMKKLTKTADLQLAELQNISRKIGTGASF